MEGDSARRRNEKCFNGRVDSFPKLTWASEDGRQDADVLIVINDVLFSWPGYWTLYYNFRVCLCYSPVLCGGGRRAAPPSPAPTQQLIIWDDFSLRNERRWLQQTSYLSYPILGVLFSPMTAEWRGQRCQIARQCGSARYTAGASAITGSVAQSSASIEHIDFQMKVFINSVLEGIDRAVN